MSFASTALQNSYRPDRRILDSIAALATRVDALEAEKVLLRAENAELLLRRVRLSYCGTRLLHVNRRGLLVRVVDPAFPGALFNWGRSRG